MRSVATQLMVFMPAIVLATGVADAQVAEPANARRTPVVEVFEKTHGAVVNISATRIIKVRQGRFDLFFQDFDAFFPTLRPRRRKLTSVGSGFVIHRSGYLITNAHVVERAVDIKIAFDDETTFDADVIATDTQHDLALIKIETPRPLPVIKLGRSDDLMVGETVIAIGNPLGYQHTLTTGVISATNRDLELVSKRTGEAVVYTDLIQTDASINPGNSGGPLLNVLGELIGINTAIRGDAQNIGFAIPVNTLQEVLPPMLIVEQQNRFSLGLTIDRDRRVKDVRKGSPAHRVGIEKGDVIARINRTVLDSHLDYYLEMLGHRPGEKVQLELTRAGVARRVSVLLQDRVPPDGAELARRKLGIELAPLPERIARQVGLRTSTGMVIAKVERGGPADRIGIKPLDVLERLDRYYVADTDEVGQILEATKSGERIFVGILRHEGQLIYRDGEFLITR